uniref:Uncharacterized protein n=1 Tax=Pycnococcus provasolii TaxID=41880 RepID=A0A6U0CFC8_9CHLO|mmetsp:Transcript_5132/g.11735  ORF Transcript_5132/g.11735 Transcript_5132/m.11735 type:complete len:565 (+) Transcript_5132:117-1811(+)
MPTTSPSSSTSTSGRLTPGERVFLFFTHAPSSSLAARDSPARKYQARPGVITHAFDVCLDDDESAEPASPAVAPAQEAVSVLVADSGATGNPPVILRARRDAVFRRHKMGDRQKALALHASRRSGASAMLALHPSLSGCEGLCVAIAENVGAPLALAKGAHCALFVFSGYRGRVFDTVFAAQLEDGRAPSPKLQGGNDDDGDEEMDHSQRLHWHSLPRMEQPRIDAAVIPYENGLVMMAGGCNDHPHRSDGAMWRTVACYDSLCHSWSDLPPMSVARHGSTGCYDASNRQIYVVGGEYVDALERARRAATDAARRAAMRRGGGGTDPLDRGRTADADGVDDLDDADLLQDALMEAQNAMPLPAPMEAFDVATSTWIGRCLPTPSRARCFAASGMDAHGRLVVAGGECGDSDGPVAEAESWMPGDASFLPMPSMQHARSAAGSVTWQGLVVVAGGRGPHGEALRTVEAWDGSSWRMLPPLNVPRLGGSLCCGVAGSSHGGDRLYAVGGATGSDRTPFTSTVEVLDTIDSGEWRVLEGCDLPVAFHACSCAILPLLRDLADVEEDA